MAFSVHGVERGKIPSLHHFARGHSLIVQGGELKLRKKITEAASAERANGIMISFKMA